jgi:hypothetical protein
MKGVTSYLFQSANSGNCLERLIEFTASHLRHLLPRS